jgi:RNA repair pathway DNA polymerase beta family
MPSVAAEPARHTRAARIGGRYACTVGCQVLGPVAARSDVLRAAAHAQGQTAHDNVAARKVLAKNGYVPVGPAGLSGKPGTWVRARRDRRLARVPNGIRGQGPSVRFEQHERHTAWDRPGGVANRSGAGDLDVIIYSARKWARLALAGNPTVLLVLFVPDREVVFRDEAGAELAANAHRFVSRLAASRCLGYLRAQEAAMTGRAGAHTNRPELVAVHGYDTKYAIHALRLGLQGIELLTTGRITLPVPEPHRACLRSIRRGERLLAGVLDAVSDAGAGWPSYATAPRSPSSRTGPGSMTGCTAAT